MTPPDGQNRQQRRGHLDAGTDDLQKDRTEKIVPFHTERENEVNMGETSDLKGGSGYQPDQLEIING